MSLPFSSAEEHTAKNAKTAKTAKKRKHEEVDKMTKLTSGELQAPQLQPPPAPSQYSDGRWVPSEDEALCNAVLYANGRRSSIWQECQKSPALKKRAESECHTRWFEYLRPRFLSSALHSASERLGAFHTSSTSAAPSTSLAANAAFPLPPCLAQGGDDALRGRVYEAETQDGRCLGWRFPFRVKENESIKFVSHLIRFCVVIIFGGVVDARWSPNDSRTCTPCEIFYRANSSTSHAHLLSDAHALSLIEGVAAAFSRGEQHKSIYPKSARPAKRARRQVPSTAPNERLQPEYTSGLLATLAAIAECLICLEEVAVDPTRPIGITIMNIVADNGAPKAYNPASKKMQSSFNNIRDHPLRRNMWLTISKFNLEAEVKQLHPSKLGYTIDTFNGKRIRTMQDYARCSKAAREAVAGKAKQERVAKLVLYTRRTKISIFSPDYVPLHMLSHHLAYTSMVTAGNSISYHVACEEGE